MRHFILLLIFNISTFVLYAQDSLTCNFEMLFTIKAGIDKADAMELVSKNNLASLTSTQIKKLPPYKNTGGDSIIKETLIYRPTGTRCFKGSNTLIQLEFADDKLYKAYISTEYAKSSYQKMLANYNELRNVIKAKWPYESQVKMASDNFTGFGYNYSKTKKSTDKTERVLVEYIDPDIKNANANYVVEVLWANLKSTRMESSSF